jgi:hypothetical protein
LTFNIDKYSNIKSNKKDKPKFVSGSLEHKQFILNRALQAAFNTGKYEPGDEYYATGSDELGMIIGIEPELENIEWEGLKAKFIELYFSNLNESYLYHPSDLRKSK